MKSVFCPAMIFQSARDITPDLLRRQGVRGLLLDLDGTLCPSHREDYPAWTAGWLAAMRDAGFSLFLLSNNKHPERVAWFCRQMGIPLYLHLARKPAKKGYLQAAEMLGIPPSAIAVVGDQIFTDVLGANLAGMISIFVYSMDLGIWYYRLRHFFEKPFLRRKRPLSE